MTALLSPVARLALRADETLGDITDDQRKLAALAKGRNEPIPRDPGVISNRDAVPDSNAPEPTVQPLKPMKMNTTSDICGHKQLVEKVIPLVGAGIMAGASTTGKTAVALSLARHLTGGESWCGKKVVERVGVAFFAYEAPGTIEPRWNAICRETGIDGGDLPFYAYGSPGSLRESDGWDRLFETILDCDRRCRKEHGVRLGMIVLDTVAASGFVADENSTDEWSKSLECLSHITQHFGVFGLLIHHAGKDVDGNPVRGSGAAYAAADVVLLLKMEKDTRTSAVNSRTILLDKIKDGGEPGLLSEYEIASRVVGTFYSGDPYTAAFVRYVQTKEKVQPEPESIHVTQEMRGLVQLMLDKLEADGSMTFGGEKVTYVNMTKGNTYAPRLFAKSSNFSEAELVATCKDLITDQFISEEPHRNTRQKEVAALRMKVPPYRRDGQWHVEFNRDRLPFTG
jgi:hypothetical protein